MFQSAISQFRDSSDESVELSIGCSESEDEILIKNNESLHCMSEEEVDMLTAPHGKFIRTTSTATTTTSALSPRTATAAAPLSRSPSSLVTQLRDLSVSNPLIAELILNASEAAEEQCNEIERKLMSELPLLNKRSALPARVTSRLFSGLKKNKKDTSKLPPKVPTPNKKQNSNLAPKSNRFFGR